MAPEGSIRAWPLLIVEPPPESWVNDFVHVLGGDAGDVGKRRNGVGNVVLVGDAAHPMWPCKSSPSFPFIPNPNTDSDLSYLTLVTDAAQGAAQGIEDAAALGELLSPSSFTSRSFDHNPNQPRKPIPIPTPKEINERLKLFESIRKPRCARMQLTSYLMAGENPLYENPTREFIVRRPLPVESSLL